MGTFAVRPSMAPVSIQCNRRLANWGVTHRIFQSHMHSTVQKLVEWLAVVELRYLRQPDAEVFEGCDGASGNALSPPIFVRFDRVDWSR